MNLAWKLRRLAAMSPCEVVYRVKQQAQAAVERIGLHRPRVRAPAPESANRGWRGEFSRTFDVQRYRNAADEVLAGRFRVFAMRPAQLGFPPQWNCDPKTGVCAPLRFGKTLNYRDEKLVGDIKYLWEPSRHAELITLAQAWRLTGESRYAQGCRSLLESWFDQCPFPHGPHWTSSLEHAIRLIHWSFAWRLLGGHDAPVFAGDGARFRERWLENVYLHCWFIANHFSRFSSANNHLLGELTGLFIGAATWPYWEESEHWRTQSFEELEREALVQNAPDGVNREQANWYHHEVADMMLLAGLAARATGADFSAQYWDRWRAMLEYVASIMDVSGRVPNYGDADDAILARLDPDADFDPFRSLLAAGAVLFADPRLKFKAGVLDDKVRWLFGDAALEPFTKLPAASAGLPVRRAFATAGYYVLGSQFESSQEVRVVADAGPLGYLSIAAHGHADALAFTLCAAGRELLIDPGTFAYHTQRKWRDYFRGTAAHNTIRIDGVDQSASAGTFLWRTHARTRVLEFSASDATQRLVAEHDGYTRLDDPVVHRREWRFDAAQRLLTVIDDIEARGEHDIEQFWHFAPGCSVELRGLCADAAAGPARLRLQLDSALRASVHAGEEDPPLGWASSAFDLRTPCSTLRAAARVRGAVRLTTQIHIESTDDAPLGARMLAHEPVAAGAGDE